MSGDSSRYLIVAATIGEIEPLLESIAPVSASERPVIRGRGRFDALVTGVGQMQTAFHLGQALSRGQYAGVLSLGIAGSFKDRYARCSLVQIVQEDLADLGAEGDERHLDLFEMKLLARNEPPFIEGALRSSGPALSCLAELPQVRSVTVNRVLHSPAAIRDVELRYAPDVVNMEGGAIFFVCGHLQVPVIAVRAISDKVGKRDKSQWDIPGAVKNLCTKGREILLELAR